MRVDTVDATLAPEGSTISIIQVDADDSVDTLLATIQKSELVIILVPEEGLFEEAHTYERLHNLQQMSLAPEKISLVIPPSRAQTLGRLASQQGVPWSSSLERAIAFLFQPHPPVANQAKDASTFPQTSVIAGLFSPLSTGAESDLTGIEGVRTAPEQSEHVPHAHTTGPLAGIWQGPDSRGHLRWKQVVPMVLVLALVVGGSYLLLPSLFTQQSTTLVTIPSVVGQLVFANSGQFDPTSARGLNDMVIIDLHAITPPAAGFALYAWLRPAPGQDEVKPVLLGQLTVIAGRAHLSYSNPTHDDLLVTFSHFLVTDQAAKPVPVTPSLNTSTWVYQAAIPTIPNPADEQHHYTVLDHLRHLLASDPTVASIGLAGGLNIWLYRNALEIQEEATTARDSWQYKGSSAYMHRQIVRVLDYLDGYNYVIRDVPLIDPFTHSESAFLVNLPYGKIGLLSLDQQQLPGYLAHVSIHLEGLAYSPGATPAQVVLARQIDGVVTRQITPLFQRVHDDAAKLVMMNAAQLQTSHALSLLNDMSTSANAAVAGPIDPVTGGVGKGVTWLHATMSQLAVIVITH